MKFPFKRIAEESHTLCIGQFDPLNIIGYGGLEEQADYLVIDGTYVRTLYISGYPFVATSGWLDGLINFNRNLDISFHLDQVDAQSALPKLNRKITELESTKRTLIKTGRIIGTDLTDPLESAVEIKNKIQRGQEKLFKKLWYISIRASCSASLLSSRLILEVSSTMRYLRSSNTKTLSLISLIAIWLIELPLLFGFNNRIENSIV